MIAVGANRDGPLCLGGLAFASRPHPAAELFVVKPGPDLEKPGTSGTGFLLLVLKQGRRNADQVGIAAVLGQSRHELARCDQSVLMLSERVLDPRCQADEITG